MSLLAVALLLHGVSVAAVTPLEADISAAGGNKTTLRTQLAPSWSTTSPVRSTANLLWTSVVTLFLCLYTVIHVNIPPPGESRWKVYRRKGLWALAAMIAPEYALWTAYEQLDAANQLQHELEDRTYCFYAMMGGFVVDVSAIHDEFRYLTIMPAGLAILAKHGHFIALSEKSIRDKSKADVLAKTLVCIQVAWLIIQSIERALNGLPIALLEIHVLAHVACALLLYGIWFEKPLDINDATLIDSSKFSDEIAIMLVKSPCNREQRQFARSIRRPDDEMALNLSLKSRVRWEKARRARETPFGADIYDVVHGSEPRRYLSPYATDAPLLNLFTPREVVAISPTLCRGFIRYVLIVVGIISLSAAYAGIHLAAWRYHFPTKAEMWLWRVSSLLIASIAPVAFILILSFAVTSYLIQGYLSLLESNPGAESFDKYFNYVNEFFGTLLFYFPSAIYFSSRLFLFIEAFISVRQMPIGVFVTVQWSDYIPHI
ncbi:hypothetical protein F4825DRAFT_467708 [Nemania diffusa]|nr:hypothetical protein F4825DRAFT_467708 [Nemania diffusa]